MNTHNIKSVGEVSFHEPFNKETFEFRHEKFSELINEDSIVLDIGAHVGGFSIIFGSCVPKGKVLAFEPKSFLYAAIVFLIAAALTTVFVKRYKCNPPLLERKGTSGILNL